MAADRVPDPSELADDLARIERAVDRGAAETRKAIDALALKIESTYVRRDVYEADRAALTDRVGKVEGSLTFTSRTAVSALILPIIVGVVVAVILATGGVR